MSRAARHNKAFIGRPLFDGSFFRTSESFIPPGLPVRKDTLFISSFRWVTFSGRVVTQLVSKAQTNKTNPIVLKYRANLAPP